MFKELVKITILKKEFNMYNMITVDNKEKKIFFNNELKISDVNQCDDFLLKFFRIVREWNKIDNNKDHVDDYIVIVNIYEKNNEFEYAVKNEIPSNFDSFLNLISILEK